MSSDKEEYSLFAANGDVVYIEDEWKEGESKDIKLPFNLQCCSCNKVMKTGTVVTASFQKDEDERRLERIQCTICKYVIDMIFDEVDELMKMVGGKVIKNMDDMIVSDDEMIDTDSSDEKKEEVKTQPEKEDKESPKKEFKVLPTIERPTSFSINGMKVTNKSKRPAASKKHRAH